MFDNVIGLALEVLKHAYRPLTQGTDNALQFSRTWCLEITWFTLTSGLCL